MWTQEIMNVVVENKETETFSKKYLWSHEDLNVHIQFVETYKWGALELTPEQYEAIEVSSADTDTYDTQYNTESQYEILDTEGPLFAHEMCAVEVGSCMAKGGQTERSSSPDDGTLEAMSDFSWFKQNYGVDAANIKKLYDTLAENGWAFLGHSYAISGEIAVMRKSEYDYLWLGEDGADPSGGANQNGLYGERIHFLNSQG